MEEYTVKMFFQSISWNTFTLVSKFDSVCFSSTRNCVYRKKMSPDSKYLIALALINNTCQSKKLKKQNKEKRKNQKDQKFLNETVAGKQ